MGLADDQLEYSAAADAAAAASSPRGRGRPSKHLPGTRAAVSTDVDYEDGDPLQILQDWYVERRISELPGMFRVYVYDVTPPATRREYVASFEYIPDIDEITHLGPGHYTVAAVVKSPNNLANTSKRVLVKISDRMTRARAVSGDALQNGNPLQQFDSVLGILERLMQVVVRPAIDARNTELQIEAKRPAAPALLGGESEVFTAMQKNMSSLMLENMRESMRFRKEVMEEARGLIAGADDEDDEEEEHGGDMLPVSVNRSPLAAAIIPSLQQLLPPLIANPAQAAGLLQALPLLPAFRQLIADSAAMQEVAVWILQEHGARVLQMIAEKLKLPADAVGVVHAVLSAAAESAYHGE